MEVGTPRENVLFLCTGNSARSILAECLLARRGEGRFGSFSAGSQPKDAPHPRTLALLESLDYDVSKLRSKSWDEFARSDAPELHFVFTVCGNAAGETCPVWTGAPFRAHWGVDDPAAATGSDETLDRAFRRAYEELDARIRAFVGIPFDRLDSPALQARLDAIGRGEGLEPS